MFFASLSICRKNCITATYLVDVSQSATDAQNLSQKSDSDDMTQVLQSSWQPARPYNDLPALPPPAELESKAILKRCITARAALAELRQAAELIPNQTMLINIVPLLEAKDSSEIENIVTPADRLF